MRGGGRGRGRKEWKEEGPRRKNKKTKERSCDESESNCMRKRKGYMEGVKEGKGARRAVDRGRHRGLRSVMREGKGRGGEISKSNRGWSAGMRRKMKGKG